MKKSVPALIACVLSGAMLFSAASCGADVSGDAYEDPALVIKAGNVREAVDISDLLFGIFLEDINYASYALDDNLLSNGNFESLGTMPEANNFQSDWRASGDAGVTIQTAGGIFANNPDYVNETLKTNVNPHYARVSVNSADGGISNSGHQYPSIAVEKGEKYTFSAFIKSPDGAAKATARVVDGSGEVFASVKFDVRQSADWIKYRREIKADKTASEDLHFELVFDTQGVYNVDAVQLETQSSTLGFKNYIYNAIKELAPKFMRFPGGCIIEGDAGNGGADTKEVYDWKNSIGAVQNGTEAGDDTVPAFTYSLDDEGKLSETTTYGEWATRSNNYDLWGYNMDYGLGFYEYFLLCESIGASPVPIVNCGFSDQGGAASGYARILNGRHNKQVADYVQDALNLIEFANGDSSTKWGKIRSDMGHPEPFGMKYIGVGNEQFTRTYYDCYEQFLDAFHEAQKQNPSVYGDVQPIVGNGMVFADALGGPLAYRAYLADSGAKSYLEGGKISSWSEYGVVDHHYYMGYDDFLYYATPEQCIYDKYEREGTTAYKVFVGEYSANDSVNYQSDSATYQTNTWMTALAEGAYMTALERNGDVIDLAAYAPMFGVSDGVSRFDGANQWDVDMMYFTNTQLLLSPNYYIQQLFMRNSGTHSLKSEITNVAASYDPTMDLDGLELQRLYQSVTYDEATKDIIVKIINAGDTRIRLNVDLAGASVKSTADCTVLECRTGSADAVNSLGQGGYAISPREFTLGVKSVFGYTMTPYSAIAIRIHTK